MTKLELIARILDGVPGVRKDGTAWLLPEHPEVSIYVGIATEVLTVARIARVTATADLVTLETHKGETYWFTPDVVAGAKFASGDGKPGARFAGFR